MGIQSAVLCDHLNRITAGKRAFRYNPADLMSANDNALAQIQVEKFALMIACMGYGLCYAVTLTCPDMDCNRWRDPHLS
jgi:hypothetical protein